MKKIFLVLLMIFLLPIFSVSANGAQCPFPYKTEITADEVLQKANQCVEARNKNQNASITEFLCPAGEFSLEDNQPISYERIAVDIAVNLLMNESDKKMREYMQNLSKSRSKDVVAWTQEYGSCIHGTAWSSSLEVFYADVCHFDHMSQLLNNNSQKRTIVASSEAFPQQMCEQLAKKKVAMWRNIGENITMQSVHKSYQNDSDVFVDGVQGQYRAIIDKFHAYQKLIYRAASKISHYIKEAVK